MNYADIKKFDIANGPGVRVSLFVSGCTHHCPGCFNPETWDFNYGIPYTLKTEEEILNAVSPDYIKGLSLLGGDPLEEANLAALLPLLRKFKATYPNKTVWCYTGYNYEEEILPNKLPHAELINEFLSYIDVLVDGRFVEAKKDLSLRFRGSSNQNLIDLKQTLATGKITLWSDGY